MTIVGAHSIVYSKDPDADRAFLKDVLRFPSVDAGEGWLIFGLPPAELAVHPSDENDVHEFYLMCDDATAFIDEMARRGVSCEPLHQQPWGLLTRVTLPGGGKLGVYQPRHARPGGKETSNRTRRSSRGRTRKTRTLSTARRHRRKSRRRSKA
jgi:hypothetical protein